MTAEPLLTSQIVVGICLFIVAAELVLPFIIAIAHYMGSK
ncbi:hypothetical protein BH11PSE13_BH11PSE13_11610 [soil metagenome]